MTLLEIIDKQMTFGPAYRLLGNLYTMKGNLQLSNIYNIRANDLVDYAPPVDFMIDNIILISRSDQYLLKQIEEAFRNFNFDWALKLCDHALKYNPDNKFLISNAIIGYLMLGFGEKALPYLEKHIIYFADDFKELMNIADLLYDKGFKSQAMVYFNQAIKLEPENSSLALWLSGRGKINDALVLLDRQLKKEPENTKILSDAVRLLLNLGELNKAMIYLNNLKHLLPLSGEVLLLTGMIKEKENNLIEALLFYEEVYRKDPKDLAVIKYLANFYIRNKLWDKAINHYRSSLNDYPNDPFLLEGIGRLLVFCPDQKLRDLKAGKEYSERAYINFKSSFAIKISAGKNLAAAYAEMGNSSKAYSIMNSTVDLARKREVSKDYLISLENLLKQYSLTN
jgi:tetratricopeptide (TPR) repeat protein